MKRRRSVLAVAALCVVGLLLALALYGLEETGQRGGPAPAATGVAESGAMDPAEADDSFLEEFGQLPDLPPDDERFLRHLRERFGATIHNKHTQIKAVEQVMAYLMKLHPDDWQSRIRDFLQALFPERAEELYARFEKLLLLNDWLAANRNDLNQMSRHERQQALWDKRYELFGADADEIWEVARKNERIADALDAIAAASDATVDQKLDSYLQAVNDAYGDTAGKLIENRATELMNTFLSVESVQQQLRGMQPEQRNEQLRSIRRGMGMDDEALVRWDALDQQRDRVWTEGEQYMQERAGILAATQDEQQQRQLLDALRRRRFGAEAEIIGNEEEGGFFRFDHPRRLGRE